MTAFLKTSLNWAQFLQGKDKRKPMTRGKSKKGAEIIPLIPAGGTAAGKGRRPPCPLCGKRVVVEFRPFCSRHCANLDLGRWLSEDYRVPTAEPITPEDMDSDEAGED